MADEEIPAFYQWFASQRLHTDPECASAVEHVCERWAFGPWLEPMRITRTLANESSPFLNGYRMLLQEYHEIFGLEPGQQFKATGTVSPLIPVYRRQCDHINGKGKLCTADAFPGSNRCPNHGGSLITEEERAQIVESISARLSELGIRATRVLADLMDNAKSEKVRLEAAGMILDRIGAGPTANINLNLTPQAEEEAEKVRAKLLYLAANNGQIVEGQVLPPESDAG